MTDSERDINSCLDVFRLLFLNKSLSVLSNVIRRTYGLRARVELSYDDARQAHRLYVKHLGFDDLMTNFNAVADCYVYDHEDFYEYERKVSDLFDVCLPRLLDNHKATYLKFTWHFIVAYQVLSDAFAKVRTYALSMDDWLALRDQYLKTLKRESA